MNFNSNRPKEIIDPNRVYIGTKTFERVGDNIKITDVVAKFDYQVPIISVMNVMEFKFPKKICLKRNLFVLCCFSNFRRVEIFA